MGFCKKEIGKVIINRVVFFLNPFHWTEDISKINCGWSILILYIGKLFTTYGIYQTIDAFRKYR